MKSYPSIPKIINTDKPVFVFSKYDGSNLRFQWNQKQGWYKFGTRTHLFDKTDKTFGCAIPIFQATLACQLEQIAKQNKWQELTVFAEFWGENSFAGSHVQDDTKYLTLFDAAPYKKGILGPE